MPCGLSSSSPLSWNVTRSRFHYGWKNTASKATITESAAVKVFYRNERLLWHNIEGLNSDFLLVWLWLAGIFSPWLFSSGHHLQSVTVNDNFACLAVLRANKFTESYLIQTNQRSLILVFHLEFFVCHFRILMSSLIVLEKTGRYGHSTSSISRTPAAVNTKWCYTTRMGYETITIMETAV